MKTRTTRGKPPAPAPEPRAEGERWPLTEQQRRVYLAILACYRDHGRPPTMRELMPAVPTTSTNGVHAHLKPIARKGWIVYAPKEDGKGAKARSIAVPEMQAAVQEAAKRILDGESHE